MLTSTEPIEKEVVRVGMPKQCNNDTSPRVHSVAKDVGFWSVEKFVSRDRKEETPVPACRREKQEC